MPKITIKKFKIGYKNHTSHATEISKDPIEGTEQEFDIKPELVATEIPELAKQVAEFNDMALTQASKKALEDNADTFFVEEKRMLS